MCSLQNQRSSVKIILEQTKVRTVSHILIAGMCKFILGHYDQKTLSNFFFPPRCFWVIIEFQRERVWFPSMGRGLSSVLVRSRLGPTIPPKLHKLGKKWSHSTTQRRDSGKTIHIHAYIHMYRHERLSTTHGKWSRILIYLHDNSGKEPGFLKWW